MRAALARWLVDEVKGGEWVRQSPALSKSSLQEKRV